MRGLVRAQLVGSSRGPNGGFVLRARPDRITLREVIQAARPRASAPSNSPVLIHQTPSVVALPRFLLYIDQVLSVTTLADLLRASPPEGRWEHLDDFEHAVSKGAATKVRP